MNDNQQLLINLVKTFLASDEANLVIEERKIDEVINNCRKIVPAISDKEADAVRKYLYAQNAIRLNRGIAIEEKGHKKWFAQRKASLNLAYWNRFKQYLSNDKHLAPKVISSMDAVSDDIVDLLGDPTNPNRIQRRGLVIGDVQSGKTLNYSGVICKAIDAGYRVIILLTGTSNDLRKQTQERIDEAIIGHASPDDPTRKGIIGAGKYDPSLLVDSITSIDKDFSKSMTTINMQLAKNASSNRPMIFVIKKNVSVLNHLYNWIARNNRIDGQAKIDNDLLLIDDEADYASINTNASQDNLTGTNMGIVKLLNVFRFASYIGFTATPFANVFIEPATEEDMLNDKINIFPKDYIYALEAPSNYIGARDIFGEKAKYSYMLRDILDGEDYYPFRHKKDSDFAKISPSLKSAINTFLVANTLYDLDGQPNTYRSMMVNVSRFVQTNLDLRDSIDEYVQKIKEAVQIYASLPVAEAIQDPYIKDLYLAFDKEYSNTDYSWQEVQARLWQSISPILVLVVDGGHKLNYSQYQDKLRAILVGGQVMSRGLTLEGLIISYLYRNTKMYDTLMQMGRWFGYRDGYARYCRIFLDPEGQNWYSHISDASDELRYDVKLMRDNGATPKDFGLKVRNNPDLPLLITSRNKMRSATQRNITTSYSGVIVEAAWLTNEEDDNRRNLDAIKNLAETIPLENLNNKVGARNVDMVTVLKLLEHVTIPSINLNFDASTISKFIRQYSGSELRKWDITFVQGKGRPFAVADNLELNAIERKMNTTGDEHVLEINKHRLGSISDVHFGLTKEDIKKVEAKVRERDTSIKNVPGKAFFNELDHERNPLLLIYLVQPKMEEGSLKVEPPIVSFAIGFPKLKDVKTSTISYYVNAKFIQNAQTFFGEEDEDE